MPNVRIMLAGFAAKILPISVRPVAATTLLAFLPAVCLAADVVSTWDGSTNDWTSPHWSSPNFPHNGNGGFSYDALV